MTVSERKSCEVAAIALERFETIMSDVFRRDESISATDAEGAKAGGDMTLKCLRRIRWNTGSSCFRGSIYFKYLCSETRTLGLGRRSLKVGSRSDLEIPYTLKSIVHRELPSIAVECGNSRLYLVKVLVTLYIMPLCEVRHVIRANNI